ncbi:MAG: capsule assembly Wzi family protein, partial [Sodaliphilus sp.]|nr:capsule assembly Wzi family protein [Sodaliphilus sp.]
ENDAVGKFRAYHQTIWEDGSGIGLQNGFDGLWGLEWRSATKSFVSGVVVEYIDFTNQSGHIHFSEDLNKDSAIKGGATGSDDYYNNYSYNGYQNRGMSIGTPFAKSLIYNTDGYMRYLDNLVRGFHIGVKGYLSSEYDYRLLFSTRKAYGTPEHPRATGVRATCFMLEANAHPSWLKGLELKAQFAFDRGSLLGNNTGGMVSVSYHGDFNIGQ